MTQKQCCNNCDIKHLTKENEELKYLIKENEELKIENEKLKYESRFFSSRAAHHLQRYYERLDENKTLTKEIEKLEKKGQKILEILME